MKTVAFHTLGCKLNYSETSTISRMFQKEGYAVVSTRQKTNILVINTCSVTDNADKECRAIVRRALRKSPETYIAVIGCYAQLKPQEIAAIDGVDVVLGAAEKFRLLDYIKSIDKQAEASVYSCDIENTNDFVDAFSFGERTRAFLKVQDGCDYTCSFCTIPMARGKSRSDSIDNVLKNAHYLAEQDIKEIVLTGVNIGDFGKVAGKMGKETFLHLIKALDEVEGIERFRISSIEPNLLTDEIIKFVAQSNRFMPHFHIPLQSGSNKILSAMQRRYKKELYENRVHQIKGLMPHCCIGVDVIVGFPGETKEDFMETYRFLNEIDVSYFHVFTYSERANTKALEITEVIPKHERHERSKMLRILSEKKRNRFYQNQYAQTRPVLFEGKNDDGAMHGFTDNYVKVQVPYDNELVNKIVPIELNKQNTSNNTVVTLQQEPA